MNKMITHNTHAYLVAGADRSARRDYAERIICEMAEAHTNSHLTTTYIESEPAISLDMVKSVLADISMTAFGDALRPIVVCEAHTMTKEASNALLKALEEPPKGVFFILLVPTVARVMSTLRSRARLISLGQSDQNDYRMARDFFRMSIPKRLEVIASLTDRREQLALAYELLAGAQRLKLYAFAQWLSVSYVEAEKSGNGRLLLETSALRLEESLDA